MADDGKLKMRFYAMLHCGDPPNFCGDRVAQIHGAGDGRLTVRAVKLFGDGAQGSRGAALLEDYSDQPGWRGLMLGTEETWEPLIRQWYKAVSRPISCEKPADRAAGMAGRSCIFLACRKNDYAELRQNVHTIGDRANKIVIDAMETITSDDKVAGKSARMRLEHAQIMRPEDLERAARLGGALVFPAAPECADYVVIASYQPTHATSDVRAYSFPCNVTLTERIDVVRRTATGSYQSCATPCGRSIRLEILYRVST
jgi:predicted amidohydrolase YtcJ